MGDASILLGIVTRNRAGILPMAVMSALAQNAPNMRVCVLDDGSSDSTPELARHFPRVQWIRWEKNLGLMSARNHLLNYSKEHYFVSLDDDAWFLEGDEVALAVDYLERNKFVGAAAFDILSADHPNAVERATPKPAAMYIGCGHVLRLAAVRQVGVYELAPGSYGGEEKDLCLRLMDAGHRIIRLPGVHVWHDKTNINRQMAALHRSGVCNDLVMTFRRTPACFLAMALIVKFYQHLSYSCRHRLVWPCLQAFRLFVRSLPSISASRRPVAAATLREFIRLGRS